MTTEHLLPALLVFSVGENFFACKSEEVEEILHMAELYTPPGLPWFSEGFLNLGGTLIPVISPARLFGGTVLVKSLYTPLIILKTSPFHLALMVDTIVEMATCAAGNLLPLAENTVFNHCVSHLIQEKERKIYLLSPQRLLLEEEKKRLEDFRETARCRLEKMGEPQEKNDTFE